MKYSQLDRDLTGRNDKKQDRDRPSRGLRALFKKGKTAEKILFIVALAVFLTSAFFIVRYILASVNTARVNANLQSVHASVTAVPAAAPTLAPAPPPPSQKAEALPSPTPGFATPNVFSGKGPGAATAAPTQAPYYFDLSGAILPNMNELYSINSDLTGWLSIPGVVNLPVVYRDNEYYLTRDFYKKPSQGGTLFVDELGPVTAQTQHLLIHGHNMQDGSMFGPLTHYRNGSNYVKQHAFASFSTLYREESYVIFAVVHTSLDYRSPEYVRYMALSTFPSENEFHGFVDQLRKHSLYTIPIDVQASDTLLTLSTCVGEDRLLVCFRKVRSGESMTDLNRAVNRTTAK